MERVSAHKSTLLAALFVSVFFILAIVPQLTSAVGTAADAQCIPAIPPCPCGQIMGQKGCTAGNNKYMCPCVDNTNGFPTPGTCVATNKCQASGKGAGDMSALMKAIGELLGKLKSSSSPPPPATTPPTTAPAGCTTYTPVSDQSLVSACTYYVPGIATGTVTGTVTGTATGTATGSTCSALDQLLGGCTDTGTGTGTGTGTTDVGTGTNASLSVNPSSGNPPLTVTFTVTDTSVLCGGGPFVLSFGDDTADVTALPIASQACSGRHITETHTYASEGSYTAGVSNGGNSAALSSATVTVVPTTGGSNLDLTNAALALSPASGKAPLTIAVILSDTSPVCPHAAVSLSFGDSSDPLPVLDGVTSCGAAAQRFNHTFTSGGLYKVALTKTGGTEVRSLSISVTADTSTSLGGSGSTDTSGSIDTGGGIFTSTDSGTGIIDDQGSPVIPIVQFSGSQVNLLPTGPTGDIRLFQSGVTILASSRDPNSNSTISGFFGSDSFSGQPQGLAQRLCASRPWTTNFLSYIIPPSFFDGLCSLRGYPVGPTTPPVTTTTTTTNTPPNVQLTQTPSPVTTKPNPNPVVTPDTTASTTATTTPSGPYVPPKVDIWAVPASVTLGSRVNIYWTTQGVASCIVSSPDGSFSSTKLSGGGSTVPLTSATTFTISCLTPDGGHTTGFVTVNLAL